MGYGTHQLTAGALKSWVYSQGNKTLRVREVYNYTSPFIE
jgi:hypothetical protein